MEKPEDIPKGRNENLTLIAGNGINLFNKGAGNEFWNAILEQIGSNLGFPASGQKLPERSSLVEFCDLLQLHSDNDGRNVWVQEAFCEKLDIWKHGQNHTDITSWARRHTVPILTTNFDTTLSDACGAELVHARKDSGGASFNHHYPWSSRFEVSGQPIDKPRNSFAIWHVNGMSRYVNSVRLGLSHYMGSVQRARTWMHRGGDRLFASKEKIDCWKRRNTWLDAFFANDLLIFGLGLGRDEVFLRWLLIERARYFGKFEKFGIDHREAWYVWVEGKEDEDSDRIFFLEHVGVKEVRVNSHDEIYSQQVCYARTQ